VVAEQVKLKIQETQLPEKDMVWVVVELVE
jgi:hypothetical protein